ncbi:hypothetical protein [Marinoscillum luteum]|uniref:Uncharacterized protein n=1 Tax=Marinoscillum luteum TaxID=861051 RepID=A0ABW7NDA9_9BACT
MSKYEVKVGECSGQYHPKIAELIPALSADPGIVTLILALSS